MLECKPQVVKITNVMFCSSFIFNFLNIVLPEPKLSVHVNVSAFSGCVINVTSSMTSVQCQWMLSCRSCHKLFFFFFGNNYFHGYFLGSAWVHLYWTHLLTLSASWLLMHSSFYMGKYSSEVKTFVFNLFFSDLFQSIEKMHPQH